MLNLRQLLNPKIVIKSQIRGTAATVYDELQSGEKIVINENVIPKGGKREPWQRVRYKGKEPEFKKIKYIEGNERLCINPLEAKSIASRKFQSLKDSLQNRGFSRETVPYNPPSNAITMIQMIYDEIFSKINKNDDWKNASLSDSLIKYKFLTRCAKEFDYEVPNSSLYLMKNVSDVIEFYTTPVRGINPYDQLIRMTDQLPRNLHVIAEPIRYNADHDERFGGINAYPHSALKVTGLRAKKKYASFRSTFEWPDI